MKTPILSALIVATVVSATPSRGWSQPAEMGKAIEKTLGQFFAAVTARDADAIRAVIDKQFVGMDVVTVAGMKSARIEYVSATDNQKLPPPKAIPICPASACPT